MIIYHTLPIGRLLVRTILFVLPCLFSSTTPANAFDTTVGTPGILALSSSLALGSIIGACRKSRIAQRANKVLKRYKYLSLSQRQKLKREAQKATGMKHFFGTTATLSGIMAVISAYLWYKNSQKEQPASSAPAAANSVTTAATAATTVTPDAPSRALSPTGRATPPPALVTVASSEALNRTAPDQPATTAAVPRQQACKPPAPPRRRPRRIGPAHSTPRPPRADSPRDNSTRPHVPRLNLAGIASSKTTRGRPHTTRLGTSSSLSTLPEPPASARARLEKDSSLTQSTSAPTLSATQAPRQRRGRPQRSAPSHAPEDEYVGPDGQIHVRRSGPKVNGWLRPDTPVSDCMIHTEGSHDDESLVSPRSLPSTPRSVPTPRTQLRMDRILRNGVDAVFQSNELAERITELARERAAARTGTDGHPAAHTAALAPTSLEQLAAAPLPSPPALTFHRGGPAPMQLPAFPRHAGQRAQAILKLIGEQETPETQHAVAAAVFAQESKRRYKNPDAAAFYKDFIADIGRTYGVVSELLPPSCQSMDAVRDQRLPGHYRPDPGMGVDGLVQTECLYFEEPGYQPPALQPTVAPTVSAPQEPSLTPVTLASPAFAGLRDADGNITFPGPRRVPYPDRAALNAQHQEESFRCYREWVAAQAARLPQPSDAADAVAQEAHRHHMDMGSTVVPDPSYQSPVASPPQQPRRPSRRHSRAQHTEGSLQHGRSTPYGRPSRRPLPHAGSRMTSSH